VSCPRLHRTARLQDLAGTTVSRMTNRCALSRGELALLPSGPVAAQPSVSGSPPDFTKSAAGDCSINGLRLAEHMVENHPSRRRVYGREHAAARIPDDRERRAQARRAAEALFASKPPVTEKPVDHSPQRPHVLPTAPPPARRCAVSSNRSLSIASSSRGATARLITLARPKRLFGSVGGPGACAMARKRKATEAERRVRKSPTRPYRR